MPPILDVEDLRVRFPGASATVEAVRGVSFEVGREKLGIVGESGSGKIDDRPRHPAAGAASRPGHGAAPRASRGSTSWPPPSRRCGRSAGQRIAMVLQDPKFSLNPVMRVGDQVAEAWRVHSDASWREARRRALEMLEAVRIRNPERVYDAYPHEVSGGMGQRVMIAMMLVAGPDLLIADEPTSALDVTVQMQVLAILDDLVTERGMGLIFISHDLQPGRLVLRPRAGHVRGADRRDLPAPATSRPRATPTPRACSARCRASTGRSPSWPVLERDPAWRDGPSA